MIHFHCLGHSNEMMMIVVVVIMMPRYMISWKRFLSYREILMLTHSIFQNIAECTKEMDGTMWNAYQIVSNRARAICYATRQQQFRMKTEHTVNQLVHTTEEQLEAMRDIEVNMSTSQYLVPGIKKDFSFAIHNQILFLNFLIRILLLLLYIKKAWI